MNVQEALSKIVKDIGAGVVAERMGGYTQQRVYNYLSRGIPDGEVLNFCRAIDWRKTPHELKPRLYPHPHDGLPEDMRFKTKPEGEERRQGERRQP